MDKVNISIFGATGTIGKNALEVIKNKKEFINLQALSAKRASFDLLNLIKEFRPQIVFTKDEPSKEWLNEINKYSKYLSYEEGLSESIKLSDKILNAISGIDGIKPAIEILRAKKILLASNKESIVSLGNIVKLYKEYIIPVDSEHNAIFVLLSNINKNFVEKIYLTASGGPFREKSLEDLKKIKKEEALKHPNWKMGPKITIDSATLMNKGIEKIEAHILFDIEVENIKVVIHPQSIVHGAIKLKNGMILANLAKPDMKVPLNHAIFYPKDMAFNFDSLDLSNLKLDFKLPDTSVFKALEIAEWVAQMGDPYVQVLLGADEEAVNLFLQEKISFLDITTLIEKTLSKVNFDINSSNIDEILFAIEWGRKTIKELVN